MSGFRVNRELGDLKQLTSGPAIEVLTFVSNPIPQFEKQGTRHHGTPRVSPQQSRRLAFGPGAMGFQCIIPCIRIPRGG
jgi:hypothetical protein